MNNFVKTVISITSYVLILLFVGVGIRFLMESYVQEKGMYVEYGSMAVESQNQGVIVKMEEGNVATFSIKHSEGWGLYSVTECTVKVLPNTTAYCQFNYREEGAVSDRYFPNMKDLSAGFMENYVGYDGNGIPVKKDGTFILQFSDEFSMETVLSHSYGGKPVTLDKEINVYENACFILRITSPDAKEIINIPFQLGEEEEPENSSTVNSAGGIT